MTARQFATALRRLGLSQSAAADRLGTNTTSVNRWVKGRRPVPAYIAAHVRTLQELAAKS